MRRYVQMLTSTWDNKYLATLVRGISRRFADENVGLHIFNAYDEVYEKDFYAHDKEIFMLPNPDNYIGMIVVFNSVDSAGDLDKIVTKFRSSNKPVITIDQHAEGGSFYGLDNYQSMYMIVEHLITEHSCRKLNYVGGPADNEEDMLRFKAFSDCLEAHGIPVEEDRVRHYRFMTEDGKIAYREFKDLGIHLPDAVVCANDNMACGYCVAAAEDGFTAPWNFRITGFDNTDNGQQYLPSITSVNRNWEQLGYDAADGLLNMLDNGIFIPEHNTVGYVKINESCGCSQDDRSLREDYMEMLDRMGIMRSNSFRQDTARKILCSAPSLDRFRKALNESNTILGIDSYAVCLNNTFFGEDAQLKVPGFTDELIGFMPGSKETIKTEVTLLPTAYILNEAVNYIFSCLHFSEYTFGYCVMPFNEDLITHGEHRALMESLSLALMNIKQHQSLDTMNEKLRNLYVQDTLTGLYNRFGYRDIGSDYFKRYKGNVYIVYADLDNLKRINDKYGHSYGDTAIKALADAIKNTFDGDEVKIRMGGDEFIVIGKMVPEEKLKMQRERISEFLTAYSKEVNFPITIAASVAYVCNDPENDIDIEDLVHMADQKMYEIKQKHHSRRSTDLPNQEA